MSSSPLYVAGGARRPAAPVIVRAEPHVESTDMRRVGPAGVMSTVFHVLLFGLFVWLAPIGHGAFVATQAKDDVIAAEPDDPPRPTELSTIVDPLSPGGEKLTYENPNIGDKSIFGGKELQGDFGSLSGQPDAPLTTMPPPPGFGNGVGGAKYSDHGVGTTTALPGAGGGDWRRSGPYEGRIGPRGMTMENLARDGGNPAALAAVAKGLKWLAYVQSSNGSWKLDGNFPDKGNANDVAGTALGLLPFLGAGKTHTVSRDNPYDKPIEKALQFLIESQDKRTGALSKDMYAHGLASIALCEAFALSKDYRLKKPAQLALNYIVAAQHPGGGWRYSPGQAGDTSVSGWQIMALKSGLMAGLDVPSAAIRRAQTFLDEVADSATEGSGYTGPQPTPTMTSVSLLCRQYISGWGRSNLRLVKGVDNYLKPNSPRPEKKDVYYYYYATQVMHNFGGDDWKAWNVKMRDQLVASQDGDEKERSTYGSWSPAGDQWGRAGGRLMVTSLNLLTLEVYYRYLPLYYREEGAAKGGL